MTLSRWLLATTFWWGLLVTDVILFVGNDWSEDARGISVIFGVVIICLTIALAITAIGLVTITLDGFAAKKTPEEVEVEHQEAAMDLAENLLKRREELAGRREALDDRRDAYIKRSEERSGISGTSS